MNDVSVRIDDGQRIGLLGRNGAGKTTLLKILDGQVRPDDGRITVSPGVVVARLTQQVPGDLGGTIADVVRGGLPEAPDDESQWQHDRAVDSILSRIGLDGTSDFATLSSGMKRRVLLAGTLVRDPDVLLLDEPTNHLDIESILWLEDFLEPMEEDDRVRHP